MDVVPAKKTAKKSEGGKPAAGKTTAKRKAAGSDGSSDNQPQPEVKSMGLRFDSIAEDAEEFLKAPFGLCKYHDTKTGAVSGLLIGDQFGAVFFFHLKTCPFRSFDPRPALL